MAASLQLDTQCHRRGHLTRFFYHNGGNGDTTDNNDNSDTPLATFFVYKGSHRPKNPEPSRLRQCTRTPAGTANLKAHLMLRCPRHNAESQPFAATARRLPVLPCRN